ncbi:alpha-galactosidase [Microbacterium sp.]|uniref:alpha-galactosidase n=1 Tax=Microbacterium sp. TaxID=51671 RepID=UPI00263117B1|nr:alpha-galactosidase [Microbacterium sp.]
MQFGLWFEPEMVNPDSQLVREHPDWILSRDADPALWRHQLVLDLTRPEAWEHVLEQMDAVITRTGVDAIKWDHNRDLHAAVSRATGRASVHAQVEAVYSLMDELHRRHPALEIESCASGGARVDLGVLEHTQRVWASDTNDPIERQAIQRWTGLLLPPELVGAHIGPERAHTTHRSASLGFRMATALFGHAGIEWDLAECTDAELDALRAWSALYRELRPLLHAGTTVRADLPGEANLLHGVGAPDAAHAVFAWVQLATGPDAAAMRIPIPGLDPASRYLIRERDELTSADPHQVLSPAWLDGPLSASGAMLCEAGLPLPVMNPGSALLLEFIREPA